MYCEKNLLIDINRVKSRLSQEFNRIENWFKSYEDDIEFFVYEDFNMDNPKDFHYVCDILNNEKQLFTIKSPTIIGLYNKIVKLKKVVKSKMNKWIQK